MSDRDDLIAATFRALGVESPEPGVHHLPDVADDVMWRAKRAEARYTGVRVALDGVMGDELHTRLNRLVSLLMTKAENAARAIDDGELQGTGEQYARGSEAAYIEAAALLSQHITVRFDGDEVRGGWMKEGGA